MCHIICIIIYIYIYIYEDLYIIRRCIWRKCEPHFEVWKTRNSTVSQVTDGAPAEKKSAKRRKIDVSDAVPNVQKNNIVEFSWVQLLHGRSGKCWILLALLDDRQLWHLQDLTRDMFVSHESLILACVHMTQAAEAEMPEIEHGLKMSKVKGQSMPKLQKNQKVGPTQLGKPLSPATNLDSIRFY